MKLHDAKKVKKVIFGHASGGVSPAEASVDMKGFSKVARKHLPNLDAIEVFQIKFTNFELLHDAIQGSQPGLARVRTLKLVQPQFLDGKMNVKLPHLRELDISECICDEVQGRQVERLFVQCPRLEVFRAHQWDRHIETLAPLPPLRLHMPSGRRISLTRTKEYWERLILHLHAPQLEELHLEGMLMKEIKMLKKGLKEHAQFRTEAAPSKIALKTKGCLISFPVPLMMHKSGRFPYAWQTMYKRGGMADAGSIDAYIEARRSKKAFIDCLPVGLSASNFAVSL